MPSPSYQAFIPHAQPKRTSRWSSSYHSLCIFTASIVLMPLPTLPPTRLPPSQNNSLHLTSTLPQIPPQVCLSTLASHNSHLVSTSLPTTWMSPDVTPPNNSDNDSHFHPKPTPSPVDFWSTTNNYYGFPYPFNTTCDFKTTILCRQRFSNNPQTTLHLHGDLYLLPMVK